MSRPESNTSIPSPDPRLPVQIRPENILDVDQPITPTSITEAYGSIIQTGHNPRYAPGAALHAAREQVRREGIFRGDSAKIVVLSPGHGGPLLKTGIIDEQNIYLVRAQNGTQSVYAASSVGQLLEMAIWLKSKGYQVPQSESTAKTWIGFVADLITQELGQLLLKTQVQSINRLLRPEARLRKLTDKRRTDHSIVEAILSRYNTQEAKNKFLIEAAEAYLREVERLYAETQQYLISTNVNPADNIYDTHPDQDKIDRLKALIITAKEDLETTKMPIPPPLPPIS